MGRRINRVFRSRKKFGFLTGLTKKSIEQGEFPREELLKNSLYYPACKDDSTPVLELLKYTQSFVYVDYEDRKEDFIGKLSSDFLQKGYKLIGQRDVKKELFGKGYDFDSSILNPKEVRLLPNLFIQGRDRNGLKKPMYADWYVFERVVDVESGIDEHFPARFSLIFAGADGIAAYDAMYIRYGLKASWLALINPGMNMIAYSDFRNEDNTLAKVVMNNTAGDPEYLVEVIMNGEPVWSSYMKIAAQEKRVWVWEK